MNYVIIILGIIIVLLLYYLYYFFTSNVNTLSANTSLKSNQLMFDNNKLKQPSSVHYAYGIWIFINSWTNGIGSKGTSQTIATTTGTGYNGPSLANNSKPIVIFQRLDGNSNLMLYLDNTQPNLYYSILDGASQKVQQRQLITNNFPIQSWTQVIVSVDNNIVDIYMNGKLVLSNVYSQGLRGPNPDATGSNGLQLGDSSVPFDATVANFQQWSNMAMDPQTAWNNYMTGNGQLMRLSSYNVKMELLKDNVTQSQISAF